MFVQEELLSKRTFGFPGRSSFILRGVGTPSFHSLPLAFSVHRLKLADIKVLGALGDSLTVSRPDCMWDGQQGGPGLI